MKISMIACSTLLGAIIATGAFAEEYTADSERHVYDAEKMRLEKSQKAEKEISSALQELKQNVDKLKSYDPSSHDNGDSKTIYEILKKIRDARKPINNHIGNIEYGRYKNGLSKRNIEYTDKDGNKIALTRRGAEFKIAIKTLENGKGKNFALNGMATKDDFAKFFANKEIVLGLIDGFIKKFHEAVETREDKVVEREKDYIDALTVDADKYSKQDMDAINSISKDLIREIKETSDALGTNHKFTLYKDNGVDNKKDVVITIKNAEHAKALSDAIDTLKINNGKKIEEVRAAAKVLMNAGVKLKAGQDLSKINETDKVKDALDIKEFDIVYNSKFNSDKKVKEAVQALTLRDQLFNFNEDSLMTSYFNEQITEEKTKLKNALEDKDDQENKFTKQIAENNKKQNGQLKITLNADPKKLAEQKRALDEIKIALDGAANGYDGTANNQDKAKKKAFDEALAKAKAAGVVITDGNESKKASDLKTKVTDALNVFNGNNGNNQIKVVVEAQQAFEEAEKTFYDSVSLRANTLIENPKNSLSSAAKDIISSMNDKNLLKNKIIHQNMVSLLKNSLVSFIKSNETSIQSATNEIGKVSNLDMVNFSNQLSTQTRLAKLSNPFNEDLALASAINKLSNDKFADNGDSVSSVIKSYTDRFNNDNNIWANVIGAKGKVKDSSNPELHGFSIGYDRAFDNTIVGGYMTLAKSKADSSLINTKASNYQIGFYGRTYIDNSEIDTRVSFGKAKNKIDRYVKSNGDVLTQNGKYDTTYTSLAVDYGYVMNLSDSLFMKPLVGLDYSHSKSKAFKESGDLPLSFNGVTSKSLNAKLGLEFRKYVDDGNYLYITPGFEAEVYKDVKDPVARFIGSNKDIKLKADDKKGRFVTLKTGAEMKLTDNLSTNINFGVKAKSKQQYFDGTVGLKYKF
ncbi:autotransporter domain protein [Campylobacter pinnipediorum subsp. caledonicus]|uniref:autotransporter outer membrane beta-barrel domain-containing protein n=1 Tax=Campylobacter pinnipediorum TaxID=1965231 RepID=UPI0009958577|nr:autotransporter outer membrane beta-barrel domain-containing protein [Campylobacter pinnipediorum]AQW86263.1 autotransporter domain protein [Campylobacter pinnipediorum subsp. caledonicus]